MTPRGGGSTQESPPLCGCRRVVGVTTPRPEVRPEPCGGNDPTRKWRWGGGSDLLRFFLFVFLRTAEVSFFF